MKLMSFIFLYLLNLLFFGTIKAEFRNSPSAPLHALLTVPLKTQPATQLNAAAVSDLKPISFSQLNSLNSPSSHLNSLLTVPLRTQPATQFNIIATTSPFTKNPVSNVKATLAGQVNVERYGAKGDGKTDDYQAILAAVKVINSQGTGELYFPKGRYYIKPYHTKDNKVQDIIIQNCKNLTIRGEQAVIEVNGTFHREIDYYGGKNKKRGYSKTSSVIPLALKNCDGVTITGLEIKGQVDQMTRTKNLTELGGHLLTFNLCSNVKVSDVYVHHAQTDGIYINNKSRDFTFNRVRSSHNARQGMSIIDLINGRFEDCLFSETGFTGGEYGGHAPQAGVESSDLYRGDAEFLFPLYPNEKHAIPEQQNRHSGIKHPEGENHFPDSKSRSIIRKCI